MRRGVEALTDGVQPQSLPGKDARHQLGPQSGGAAVSAAAVVPLGAAP